jgi:hypothetical protein
VVAPLSYGRRPSIPLTNKPATREANGAGHGGPARGYSWPPFEEGNTASLRHGLYASRFQLLEGEKEIEEIADAVRAALPIYASAFEVGIQLLAGRIWRLKRGYQHVARTPRASYLSPSWKA